ncbi:hypothetical protein MKJ04_15325 [Pontibacter sp. E15-1]|uniref:hypothetical protein n=1 Tax=Pontibacter sp. E15-1 TaxID=2919918 RepID=UPI001F502BCC|nr:hypothetical protein [Pontibacter sp. E15-1]MCJ8166218.1 hypothetical protein [Pontibacter sp. E15-1]
MKRNILFLFLLLPGMASYAQHLHVTDDSLDKIVLAVALDGSAMANIEMKKELALSENQYEMVERLNADRYQKMLAAEQLYAANAPERSKTLQNIVKERDQVLREILSEQQMRHLLDLEGRFNVQFVSEIKD